jgi:RNA methyltransferase, TrmH family
MNTPGNQLIKEVAALRQKKVRDESGLILVEGRHPIEEAVRAGLMPKHYFVLEPHPTDGLPSVSLVVAPFAVDEKQMGRMATTDSPPPCLAVFERPVLKPQVQGSFVLVLDRIQDPGNLGTLIRSAVAFGVETVILTEESAEPYNPKVIRASAGLVFAVSVIGWSYPALMELLTDDTWNVYGTTGQSGALSYREVDYYGRCALVLGNEGAGISEKLMQVPGMRLLTIPMAHAVESLNVAISGSIIMAEAAARRKAMQPLGREG